MDIPVPSRKVTYLTKREKPENHRLKTAPNGMGDRIPKLCSSSELFLRGYCVTTLRIDRALPELTNLLGPLGPAFLELKGETVEDDGM